MKKLDLTASAIILVIILLLSIVIFIGNHIPITVTCQLPTSCAEVGPFGSIVFEFSRPVKSDQAGVYGKHFRISVENGNGWMISMCAGTL